MPPTDPLLRLEPASTAVLLIDLQEKLLPAVTDAKRLVARTRLLLRVAAVLGMKVVATTQYAARLGPIVPEVAELLPADEPSLDKTAFSCFDAPGFALPGVRNLIVAGIEAHICVAGTVLGALRHGLGVEVAADAISSRRPLDAAVGLTRMERAGALITTAEMAAYELLGGSGTPAFKAMLPYFKELG